MPRASEATAAAEKAGLLINCRAPCCRSRTNEPIQCPPEAIYGRRGRKVANKAVPGAFGNGFGRGNMCRRLAAAGRASPEAFVRSRVATRHQPFSSEVVPAPSTKLDRWAL